MLPPSFAAPSQAPLLAGSLCSRRPRGLVAVIQYSPYLQAGPALYFLPALPEPLLTCLLFSQLFPDSSNQMWSLPPDPYCSVYTLLSCWLLGPCLHLRYHDHDLLFTFFFFLLFRATPVAYGSSQARGRIGAAAAGLCHSHSNARSLTH